LIKWWGKIGDLDPNYGYFWHLHKMNTTLVFKKNAIFTPKIGKNRRK
jgi:hypothetical protein